jgi:transcriptional regulator with GAF, ATPase, and Fis domain
MTNELEFFNQATLRICSSVDINEVAQECLDFLEDYIPLDGVAVTYFEEKSRSLVIMALKSRLSLNRQTKLIPISQEGHQAYKKIRDSVLIFNNPEKRPITPPMWMTLGLTDNSSIVLFMSMKGRHLGQIDFFVRGRNRYTDEHAHLIGLLHRPFSMAMANSLQYQDIVNIKELFDPDIHQVCQEPTHGSESDIIGAGGGLQNVMGAVTQVAPLNTPVLLMGETGVGKEIIANRIHYSSPRREGPFMKINCGAIPEGLIDSELFGHEKGAFTGALARKNGLFERAHQGTLFLDEVGDLPASVQVRLLRVLQEKEIERVGGTRPIKVDVRIIAATHRNMAVLIREGSFRLDLWFRINVFPITIPSLRERKSDIPNLVRYFIMIKSRELNLGFNPELAPGTMERLIAYDWPGNVRELQNLVERALIQSRITGSSQPLRFEEFSLPGDSQALQSLPEPGDEFLSLDEAMKLHIQSALDLTHGKIHGKGGAAELLKINPNTLRHRMRMLGIPYGRKRANIQLNL